MTQEQQEVFFKEHPFQFNLLRLLDNGALTHINSLYKGYNCTDGDCIERNSIMRKRIICHTQEEIDAAIANHKDERQHLYILTKLKNVKQRPADD